MTQKEVLDKVIFQAQLRGLSKAICKDVLMSLKKIDMTDIAKVQYECLKVASICFTYKHLGFKEEKEYRIFSSLWKREPFTNDGRKHINYIFEPKHVKRIVIGPSNKQEQNIKKIEDYLNTSDKYNHIELYKSTIPYVKKEHRNSFREDHQ